MLDVNATSLRQLLHLHAGAGRTGALHVGGTPGGVLYLVAGHITYAESPACAGVGERLVASGRVPARVWRRAYTEGAPAHRVGRTLIRDGHLGQHELACRVVAAIGDATRAMLRSDDATATFVEGERHWLGVITSVGKHTEEDAHHVRLIAATCLQDGPR
jgi:hypothetical protein